MKKFARLSAIPILWTPSIQTISLSIHEVSFNKIETAAEVITNPVEQALSLIKSTLIRIHFDRQRCRHLWFFDVTAITGTTCSFHLSGYSFIHHR